MPSKKSLLNFFNKKGAVKVPLILSKDDKDETISICIFTSASCQ